MGGLTIRAHFAALAMQGILAGPLIVGMSPNSKSFIEALKILSVGCADALIDALNQPAK